MGNSLLALLAAGRPSSPQNRTGEDPPNHQTEPVPEGFLVLLNQPLSMTANAPMSRSELLVIIDEVLRLAEDDDDKEDDVDFNLRSQ